MIMSSEGKLFDVVQPHGRTLLLAPLDLSEFKINSCEREIRAVIDQFEGAGFRNIVLDCDLTDYCGSTALGFFIKLWQEVQKAEGKFVFCNVSEHELEVFKISKWYSHWLIVDTRADAFDVIDEG